MKSFELKLADTYTTSGKKIHGKTKACDQGYQLAGFFVANGGKIEELNDEDKQRGWSLDSYLDSKKKRRKKKKTGKGGQTTDDVQL